MGVPGPVTSAASAGVNHLIRLGQASIVTTAQDVITDIVSHAALTSTSTSTPFSVDEHVDESFVPAPVRSSGWTAPRSSAGPAAPRR